MADANFRFKKGDIVIAKESFVYQTARVKEGDVFRVETVDPNYENETILIHTLDDTFAHWVDDKYFDHFNPSCEELDDMMSDF